MPGGCPANSGDAVAEAPPLRPITALRPRVHLTKREAFEACQTLADADRVLVAAGATAEAGALGDLFELLEDRMTPS